MSNGVSNVPKPEVIGSSGSTYTRVVLMVCEEKGIPYTLTETAIFAPELFKVHPLGKMPALRHGDVCLFESKAIATYLDRTFAGPELFPSAPIPASLTEQWVSFVNTVVDRTFIRTYLYEYIAALRANRNPDRNVIEQVLPDLHRQIAILDTAVKATGFLVADRFTFADINLMPILHRLAQAPEGKEALSRAVHLSKYYEQHAQRISFQRTRPPEGPPSRATQA
jgi:glutathione S-transferase